jgi:hypothetical protein
MVSITHGWNENYTDSVPQILGKVLNLNKKNITHMNKYCIWQCASITVRRVKGLLGLSPLGLISRLLRGQVRPLLYIRREDVSI